jgi:hypothetical protein
MAPLSLVCLLLFAVGIAILWKQANAKQCPAHNHRAGLIAIGISLICLLAAIVVVLTLIAQHLATHNG